MPDTPRARFAFQTFFALLGSSLSSLTLTAAPVTFSHDSRQVNAETASGVPWWQTDKFAPQKATPSTSVPSVTAPGYRGIWYTLGSVFKYGDKYSGGLGTYTANHQPMAEYAPAVNKTFFTYGGAPSADKRELVIMVSYYDHTTGTVPRPVALYADPAVDDPHDNAALTLDREGYIWVFKSGRATRRPGIIFRSTRPYDISAFEQVALQEFTYPQVWAGESGAGFFLLFTKYFKGTENGPARHLFWKTSLDGRTWSDDQPLATFGGHYQTSGRWQSATGQVKYATFFNYHPDSHVDRRTNLYYAQTTDGGKTWTTADGKPLKLPLKKRHNSALVLDLQADKKFMYTGDLNFDADGNPILLCVVSRAGEPGPAGDPREWTILHWTGQTWKRQCVAISDHNYDMGSLVVRGDEWRILGPTGEGPQKWGAGGEMVLWVSRDRGATWAKPQAVTAGSPFNHSYARRPLHAHEDFTVFWADGDTAKLSPSRIYFANADGTRVYRLPYEMTEDTAKPELVSVPVTATQR